MRMMSRRITLYILTAIVAITVNFFIPRLMPGNPALAVLGRVQAQESKQAIAALELQYGVQTKTGLWGQYMQYWSHLLHGNLGTSLNSYPASVGSLIRDALPWTIGLVGVATVISFVLGTLLGVAAAWRRGTWLDGLLPAMAFFQAAPYFFVAILAVALFSTKLGWFPPNSGYDTTTVNPGFNGPFLSSVLDHAMLPAVTIVLASIAGWIIGMRNMMITTMDEDYVLLGAAKGLPSHRVVSYAARNALLPSAERPAGNGDDHPDHHVVRVRALAHEPEDDDEQRQRRQDQEDVGQHGQAVVGPAAEVTRGHAEQHRQHGRRQAGDERDQDGAAPAHQQLGQHVLLHLGGAEQVRRRGRQRRAVGGRHAGVRAVRSEQRADDRQQSEHHGQAQPDHDFG